MRRMGYSYKRIRDIQKMDKAANAIDEEKTGFGPTYKQYIDRDWVKRRRNLTWHPIDGVVWEDTKEPANYHKSTDIYTRKHQLQHDSHVKRWRAQTNKDLARARANKLAAQGRQRAAKHGTWISKDVLDLTK